MSVPPDSVFTERSPWSHVCGYMHRATVPGGFIYAVPNVLVDGNIVSHGGPVFVPEVPKLRRLVQADGEEQLVGPHAVIFEITDVGAPGAACEVRFTAGEAFVAWGSLDEVAAALGLEIAP